MRRRGSMATSGQTAMNPSATVSPDTDPQIVQYVSGFYNYMGALQNIKPEHDVKDSFSNLTGGLLKVISVEPGKISCLLDVESPILNGYGGMHGGAVGAVADKVATACARTVVGKEKDIFLGEMSISYLSAAPHKVQLVVDGSVVRSGRNLTVVTVDFQHKESERLAFMTRATFYNMPVSRL